MDARWRSPRLAGRPGPRRHRGSRPRASVTASTWAAKASVISRTSTSPSCRPHRASTRSIAGAGADAGQPRIDAHGYRAADGQPGRRRSACHQAGTMATAAAPSLIPQLLPAVAVPPGTKAPGIRASTSALMRVAVHRVDRQRRRSRMRSPRPGRGHRNAGHRRPGAPGRCRGCGPGSRRPDPCPDRRAPQARIVPGPVPRCSRSRLPRQGRWWHCRHAPCPPPPRSPRARSRTAGPPSSPGPTAPGRQPVRRRGRIPPDCGPRPAPPRRWGRRFAVPRPRQPAAPRRPGR
jgi:hypothetical protein